MIRSVRLTSCERVRSLVFAAVVLALTQSACESGRFKGGIWVHRDEPEPLPAVGVESNHPAFNSTNHKIELQAAINECLTVDFSLRSEQPVESLDITVSDWSSENDILPPSIVRIYRACPVQIRRHPPWQMQMIPTSDRLESAHDALVPAEAPYGGLPTSLTPGQSLHITLDICVPPNAAPETYESLLTLTSNDRELKTLPMTLEVRPIVLPHAPDPIFLTEVDYHGWIASNCPDVHSQSPAPVPTIAWANERVRKKLKSITTDSVTMLADHGVAVAFDGILPGMKTDAAYRTHPVWPPIDQVLATVDEAAGPLARFKIPFDGLHPFNPDDPSAHDPLKTYLADCANHFAENGWLDRAYVEIPVNNRSPQQSGRAKRSAKIIHNADPRLPVVASISPAGCREFELNRLHPAAALANLSALALPARWCAAQSNQPGVREWARIDRPPYSGTIDISATTSDIRVLGWQAGTNDITLLMLGNTLSWPRDAQSATPQTCVDHAPTTLVYPGEPFGLQTPIPSRRLKTIRRAAQDHAYLQLLKSHGMTEFANTITRSLVPHAFSTARRYADTDPMPIRWPRHNRDWESARRAITNALVRTTNSRFHDPDRDVPAQQQLNRLLERRQHIDMHVEGVRILPERKTDHYRVDVWVRIDNLTTKPIAGNIWFETLPTGWQTVEPGTPVPTIEPGQAKIVSLSARVVSWTRSTGHPTALPIVANLGTDHLLRTSARVSALTPMRTSEPITIDGNLADWPDADFNVAADFVSITGQPEPANQNPPACFVMHDDEFIYIAANSQTAPETTAGGNALPCDDGLPAKTTRFEVLIDPNNAGTHDPADLFHIAIGFSGSLFEKGIDLNNTGTRHVWSADIRYATSVTDNVWTIEMRIPRSSISPAHDIDRVWGLNFAFFDATNQTLRTWSGARYNPYDPMALGNLIWPN